MEGLLNKLIEKGRVPFGDKRITNVKWDMQYVWTYNWVFWSNHNVVQFWKSTRELVSKESLLWQFVCENGMVKNVINTEYTYRLIESALKEESELEDFLLQSIVIDNE